MILRTYASNQPLSLALLPVVTFSVLLVAASQGRLQAFNADFPVDRYLIQWYNSPWLMAVAAGLLITAGAYLSNRVFNRHEFFNVPVYVPALMYMLLATTLAVIQLSIPALLANTFVMLGLNSQLKIFHQPRVLAEFFESGFWCGMAAVCFPPYLMLLIAIWSGTMLTRAFHWREYVLPAIAFAVPFAYWISWLYFRDTMSSMVLFRKWLSFDAQSFFANWNRPTRAFAFMTLLSVLFALPRYLFLSERSSNKAKMVRTIFFVVALTIVAAYFLGYSLMWKWIVMTLLLPVSFLLGYWFANYRVSLVAPFFFYAFVVASFWCAFAAILS